MRIENPLGVRSISVSRALFGQSGGGSPLELALRALQSQKDILPCQSGKLHQNEKLCQNEKLHQNEKLCQSATLRQNEKLRQNATLTPPTMRPVMPMPSSTKPRTLWPPAWTQTAPA